MSPSSTTTLRRRRRRARIALSVTAAVVSAPTNAFAGMPTVIFSNIHSSPTSAVPGYPGVRFDLESIDPIFGTPYVSPNGDWWILRCVAEDGRIIVRGSSLGGSSAAVVVHAFTPTFFDPDINYISLGPAVGIDDDGAFAFAADTDAPDNSDVIVARWSPADGFELIAREGVQAAGEPPGVGYGAGAGAVQVLADDRVAFKSAGLTGGGGSAFFVNTAIDDGFAFVRSGVTVPEQQLAGAQNPVAFADAFRIDATGENSLYFADLAGAGNVIAFNNVVVAQHDLPLPGGYPGLFVNPLIQHGMTLSSYNGHYAFRCPADRNANGIPDAHVVVVDGRVVAATDEPIVPGSPYIWRNGENNETPFIVSVVNSRGDYVVRGIVSLGGVQGGSRFVVNGRTIITNGQVDMNGDGLPNDGISFSNVRVDSGFLTDDGKLFFTAMVGNGQESGEAFLWMPVPVRSDLNCDGRIDFFDIDPFLLALFDEAGYAAAWPDCWRITADINRDGDVNFFDIDPFIACMFAVCP